MTMKGFEEQWEKTVSTRDPRGIVMETGLEEERHS